MSGRTLWLVLAALVPVPASAQLRLVGRVDMAIFNPDSAQVIHLAYDLGAGLDVGAHSTILFDVVRQNWSGQTQGFGATWLKYVGGAWEYAFGDAERYQRQFTLGLRGGEILASGPYAGAPYLGVTLGFRYPVIANLRLHGRLEDVFVFRKSQTIRLCDSYGDCSQVQVGGRVRQNYGLFLGVEVHS